MTFFEYIDGFNDCLIKCDLPKLSDDQRAALFGYTAQMFLDAQMYRGMLKDVEMQRQDMQSNDKGNS